ncbi:pseudouridine synthase PUS7 [Aspergillus homomorphus CBS 101889]|uniref:Putative pseudouridine synthase TruD/Pus7 n=1 Tax=Aspergillus homomorphus (strain CBS 101889) TaxID=1450537 RepID=A0A395ICV4_ASPHC|nr:putative pseudouridine synthase TruD/Pus7 [Aspergillus homomorphus CBS 101889]RAL17003.1 putative pseudouridine synthase TruD/Pus7 [Aspergillus homomorphus CBS 101889]
MEGADVIESPRKRIKTDNTPTTDEAVLPQSGEPVAEPVAAPISADDAQARREVEVGITGYVSADNEGFSGILKKRYTDFLVNEIVPSGEVLHLQNVPAQETSRDKQKKENPGQQSSEKPVEKPQQEETQTTTEKDAAPTTETPVVEFQISDEDNALLESLFGEESTKMILALNKRALENPKSRPSDFSKIATVVVTDRDLRIKMHQAIRRIFNSQLESQTDSEGMMNISVAPNRNNKKAQGGRGNGNGPRVPINWDELGGPYLHFTIYKENKDTMEILNFIGRQLKVNSKTFQFAGTKDRRGVTVQRACAYRVQAERLAKLNPTLRNAVLGDFEYRKYGLDLGDLNGNEFVITLRDCEIPGVVDLQDREAAIAKSTGLVKTALHNLRERGYFNYFGLQRFGTFATRTDTVGVMMLQGDFKGACDAILHYSPHTLAAAQEGDAATALISSDDRARSEAIHLWTTTANAGKALEKLPRKFSAEANIMRQLGRSKADYLGALQAVPRNLRLMYVHAYQSLVWNFAATERWRLYGDKVVEGDLVLIHEHINKDSSGGPNATGASDAATTEPAETVDADGEVIITPDATGDSAYVAEGITRARALTAEEAASGKYNIFDVVLTLPGYDVLYPANAMTDFYKEFMGSEQGGGLDPFDMRRKWKDVSLTGGYRKLLNRMGPDYSVDVKVYEKDDEQFVATDLERLRGSDKNGAGVEDEEMKEAPTAQEPEKRKLAVVLKFQLGSSQYATMALRELTRGKVKAYTPDYGKGR